MPLFQLTSVSPYFSSTCLKDYGSILKPLKIGRLLQGDCRSQSITLTLTWLLTLNLTPLQLLLNATSWSRTSFKNACQILSLYSYDATQLMPVLLKAKGQLPWACRAGHFHWWVMVDVPAAQDGVLRASRHRQMTWTALEQEPKDH